MSPENLRPRHPERLAMLEDCTISKAWSLDIVEGYLFKLVIKIIRRTTDRIIIFCYIVIIIVSTSIST